MYDYINLTQRDFEPETFILHVGTNALPGIDENRK